MWVYTTPGTTRLRRGRFAGVVASRGAGGLVKPRHNTNADKNPALVTQDDHEFLLAGGVFTQDLIETWVDWKRENEVLPIQHRPHPHEFELYYDI